VLTSSAPDPGVATEDDYSDYCLACLQLAHPEAKQGLLLARAHGSSFWDDHEGCWVAETEDGHEVVFASGDEPIPGQLTVGDVLADGHAKEPPTS
jgi:hypothetical protein